MHVDSTECLNPLATIIARLMVDIARGESLVRQRSMLLSIAGDNRESLARRRGRLERETALYIAGLHNLARDHGLDPLAALHGVDLEFVRLALLPLARMEAAS